MSEIHEIIIPFSNFKDKEIITKIKDYISEVSDKYAVKENVNKELLKESLYVKFSFKYFYENFLSSYIQNFLKIYADNLEVIYGIKLHGFHTNFPSVDSEQTVTVSVNKEFVEELINITNNENYKNELRKDKYLFKNYLLSYFSDHTINEIERFAIREGLNEINLYNDYPLDIYEAIFNIRLGI